MARQRLPIGGARVAAVTLVALALLAAALPGRVAQQDLVSDRAALLALSAALDLGGLLPWDPTATTPCGWRGVTCNQTQTGNRVVELHLPGKRLAGTIPPGTLGNLTALLKLSLRHNGITGEIPADVGNCGELRALSLRNNRFTGAVPDGFFSLAVLRKVDLALNHLTGGVSQDFNRLKQLDQLFLESNDFTGELPAGFYLPNLTRFNVSFNPRLTGPVPASLARMPTSAFLGTGLCDGPLAACTNSTPPAPPPHKKHKLSRWAIVGIIVGAALILLLIVGLVACLRRRRAPTERPAGAAANVHEGTAPITVTVARTDRDAVKQSHAPPLAPAMISEGKKLVFLGSAPERPYDLETLLRASAEVLGKGPLGTTYRATLDGGEPVLAIKRLREVNLSESEFQDKAAALGALHHENLPRLRAYFYSKEEKLLVYDFVGAGSLSALLHDGGAEGRARLDFTARARMALAVAHGVAFIHSAGAKSSHGNIKSSNIVVTATRDGAFVSDYGIAQLAGAAELPKRDAGYHAPEVTDARAVPQSADVYSFGVVVLELLSGRAPGRALALAFANADDGVDLPRWVRSVVQEEWTSEVFDAAIANEPRVQEEMLRLLQLGMECTEQHPDRRPSMAQVETRLERIVEDASQKADFSSTDGSRSVSS
ncbi:putative inactive receptor kinase [Dichanthelium oligosanthes]|uniref:Putative inactive receptor kinase n=1 Tax=Dichanthelium oligosanthes TaxID=888268 RepID=A0A1E5WCQ8_9POAL|nr:putative inactive receptor kinase [Dichanthelium oligosanthes]